MALGAAQIGRRAARGAQPQRRHPGRPDRVAEARPDRRHQRRPRPGHLHQAVGHRADDRAVRRRTRSSSRGRTRPPRSVRRCSRPTTWPRSSPPSTTSSPTSGKNNPQFAGKKVLLLGGHLLSRTAFGSPRPGWRTDFLTQMGFTIPDTGGGVGAARQDGVGPRRRRRADLDHRERRRAGRAACRSDRRKAAGRPFSKRNVFTGKDLAGAIAFASTLSYPVVADQLPPLIAKALA